jgi:hypothetical protein
MEEVLRIVLGAVFLLLGIPIGKFLAKITKEELKAGQPWFKAIIIVSLVGAIASAFYLNDILFFSFLFIAIVTSKSLKR